MSESKTSTFTIHHDRCKPEEWRPRDVLALASFLSTGDLRYAARLSLLGVQLVLSEHHEPKGGTLEHIGWSTITEPHETYEDIAEAVNASGDDELAELTKIYRGHPEYVVPISIGDGDGNFDGYEYEPKATRAEALALIESMKAAATETSGDAAAGA